MEIGRHNDSVHRRVALPSIAAFAEKIIAAEQVINYNKDAFREFATAGVPVQVVRTSSYGVVDPSHFALIIQDADAAEMQPRRPPVDLFQAQSADFPWPIRRGRVSG